MFKFRGGQQRLLISFIPTTLRSRSLSPPFHRQRNGGLTHRSKSMAQNETVHFYLLQKCLSHLCVPAPSMFWTTVTLTRMGTAKPEQPQSHWVPRIHQNNLLKLCLNCPAPHSRWHFACWKASVYSLERYCPRVTSECYFSDCLNCTSLYDSEHLCGPLSGNDAVNLRTALLWGRRKR